jgi:eukaryotic-like serine/threonine-protein kinase
VSNPTKQPPSTSGAPIGSGSIIAEKYRLEELLGRGGMGSVWRAVHVRLGHRVAIKIIAPMYVALGEARRRFDNEAKAAAALRSRHIVQVYDNGELNDGTPYIVMEYLEGQPLSERLAEGRAMAPGEALVWLKHVGRALVTAHAAGIVHRDLKPENIFLAKLPGEDEVVAKVLDFGIAKINAEGFEQGATQTGSVMGTPVYMSPEQARGLKTVDGRSDLYSLGQVAYTLLTGKPAFKGGSLADVIIEVCTQPLPSLLAMAPWLPPPFGAWYQKACARDPAERFASVSEFLEAFSAATQASPGAPRHLHAPLETQVAPGLPVALAYLNQRGALAGVGAVGVPQAAPSGPRREPTEGGDRGGDTASTPASRTLGERPIGAARRRIAPLALFTCVLLGAFGVGAIGVTRLKLDTRVPSAPAAPRVSSGGIDDKGVGRVVQAPLTPSAALNAEAPANPPAQLGVSLPATTPTASAKRPAKRSAEGRPPAVVTTSPDGRRDLGF